MKKIAGLLLLSLLMFTSCVPFVSVTRSPKDTEAFYVDSLPDIGEFSGYNANEMFDENVGTEFVPSDDYGEIIPYIGSYRLFETPPEEGSDWHTEVGYCSYGFCTPDGRIVMEASDKNAYLNYRQTDDGFGYYTVTREIQPKDDAPDEYLPGETYIIPRDGSWCLTLKDGSWITNAGGGYIGVCEYPENNVCRTLLYDYNGNLVRTFDGVDNVGVCSSGLMLVSKWTDIGYSAHFVDENGKKVLGPYSSACDFNEHGVAAVEDENEAYLVNAKGERLTNYYESFYREFSNDMKNHVFVGRYIGDNKTCDIYSQEGALIGTVSGTSYLSFRFPKNGEIMYYYTRFDNNEKGYPIYNSERMVWGKLSDGEEFKSAEFGVSPNSYLGSDNCYVHIDKTLGKGYFFDADGETIAVIDEISDVMNVSDGGEYIVYYTGEYDYSIDETSGEEKATDTRQIYIYDSAKKEIVYTLKAGGSAYFADNSERFVLISVYDETDFFGGLTKYWLFDTLSGKILFEECNNIALYDVGNKTYINVCTENSSAVYDEDLNLIRKSYYE